MSKKAWLFPGQGTQKAGMGKAVYDASEAAREVFRRADDALGWPLSALCFNGPDEELTLTANAQPAIVATSIATLAALRESFPELPAPACAAGHSLGEYSALVAAGALDLADAVRAVHERGKAMQEAVAAGDGAMAAIMGGAPEDVAALCDAAREEDVLTPANFNAPGQVVIAGSAAAVGRARALAKERKLKAIPLKVSAPFHCELMAPAAERMRVALADVAVKAPEFPVLHNVDARPCADASGIADRLIRQICGAVQWQRTVEQMRADGIGRALEIGPGRVLAGLVRKIDAELEVQSVSEPSAFENVPDFLA